MSECIGYRSEIDFSETVNKIAEQLNRRIDEAAVEQVEDRLAELGYVKVVRCRDCDHWATEARFTGYCLGRTFDPNGFCSWAERKVR